LAAYNKHDIFTSDLATKVHNLSSDLIKVLLTNVAPIAANATKSALTEITAGNGYSAGGASVTPSGATASGTYTLTGTAVVFTASGGTIGPFRYVDLYNDTPTSPADPLIAWWDYGSSITLNSGETFTVKFNSSPTTGTILTIA
jgi:hypothetical protein